MPCIRSKVKGVCFVDLSILAGNPRYRNVNSSKHFTLIQTQHSAVDISCQQSYRGVLQVQYDIRAPTLYILPPR
jgi:hypothetical protein